MNENQRHYKALELDKILKLLAGETACEDAARQALELEPSSDLEEVRRRLSETDDAFVLLAKFGSPPFGGLKNITNSLRRAESGGTLSMAELLRVAEVLRTLRGIVEWRSKGEGMPTSLDGRFESLMPNRYLEDRIGSAILSDDEMADDASPVLASIRRKIRSASNRAREVLDHMIHSQTYQKYLQDPIVTIRGGRFVVPVRAECRNDVPGLVHDTSASGSTLFIEPMSAVEANNQVKVLLSEEEKEKERILKELSAEVGNFAESTVRGYETAVGLNVIFSKASLAYKMKASVPEMNENGRIRLKKARHPLIDKNKVVPTDIELGTNFDTLVITGPNTGGKTVSLKTAGLFTLMAMCGLMIPAEEHSELSVFSRVLADIGDEQSIEQSLSTFSAHMTNIIEIIGCADGNSLVLLDELGAGTDPVEGAALAMAILEELRRRGAKVAATTHYAELKAYALQTAGVENACCEFDVATLCPTYRLLIGIPGRSNAFAISLRLGMDGSVVERAKELVSSENTRFEDVVQSLEVSRQRFEKEREAAERERAEAHKAMEEARTLRDGLRAQTDSEMAKARAKAADLVSRTRGQVDALLNEMDEIRKQKDRSAASEQIARMKSEFHKLENTADPVNRRKTEKYVLPRPLKPGDSVEIRDIDKKGTVLRAPEGNSEEVLIQAGIVQTRVPLSNLRLVEEKPERKIYRTLTTSRGESPRAGAFSEIDLRGQMTEEAVMNVDRFIDSAQLSGIGQLTIIHGKGTGALRTAVQQHLKHHPAVKSFRLGTYGEGESGVTIVELK